MLLSAALAMAPNANTMLAATASATLARFVILPPFVCESVTWSERPAYHAAQTPSDDCVRTWDIVGRFAMRLGFRPEESLVVSPPFGTIAHTYAAGQAVSSVRQLFACRVSRSAPGQFEEHSFSWLFRI